MRRCSFEKPARRPSAGAQTSPQCDSREGAERAANEALKGPRRQAPARPERARIHPGPAALAAGPGHRRRPKGAAGSTGGRHPPPATTRAALPRDIWPRPPCRFFFRAQARARIFAINGAGPTSRPAPLPSARPARRAPVLREKKRPRTVRVARSATAGAARYPDFPFGGG